MATTLEVRAHNWLHSAGLPAQRANIALLAKEFGEVHRLGALSLITALSETLIAEPVISLEQVLETLRIRLAV